MSNPSPAPEPSAVDLSRQLDVLVIGSGAAGLYAALCCPAHLQVGIITKEALKTGASNWAQGGIAAAIAPEDSPLLHLDDTLKAGAGLCNQQAVQFLVDHATEGIDSLAKLGVAFDRHGSEFALTSEAAHSRPRVLHAADTTGKAIVSTLRAKVKKRPNLKILSQAVALSLWLDPNQGHCQGVSLLYQGKIHWLRSSATILATGGGGRVYAQTTNPAVSTGDGVALAWRAGAVVKDLEFFQFHPTALMKKGAPCFLISEAVRGEGAHLIDAKGDRFAFRFHPRGELAPRDVVSRAIFNHLQQTETDPEKACVYLDLRPIPTEQIQRRFPNIIKRCSNWGIDIFSEPIPVAPAAHYWMGGVSVDLDNRTSIPGLYAIGETACTGVHGANRLASNSLLECIVFAAQFAHLNLEPMADQPVALSWRQETGNWAEENETISQIRQALPGLMWRSAGISRTEAGLTEGLEKIQAWRKFASQTQVAQYVLALDPTQGIEFSQPEAERQIRAVSETLNLLDNAYLILKSAQFRQESRGGHYRSDYPENSDNWQAHTHIEGEDWGTAER